MTIHILIEDGGLQGWSFGMPLPATQTRLY